MAQGMGNMPRRPGYGGYGTLGSIVDPMRQNGRPLNPDFNLLRVLGPSSPNTGRVLPNDNGFRLDPAQTHFTNIYNSLPNSAQGIYDNMSRAQKIAFEKYTFGQSQKRIPVDRRYRNDQMYMNGGKQIANNIGQNAANMIFQSRLRVPSGAIKPPNGPRF